MVAERKGFSDYRFQTLRSRSIDCLIEALHAISHASQMTISNVIKTDPCVSKAISLEQGQ